MYHSHAFVPRALCLQTRVYCTESVKVSLNKKKKSVCVVDIISVGASSWALTISTLERSEQVTEGSLEEGITVVLSHSHCTIDPYLPLLILLFCLHRRDV